MIKSSFSVRSWFHLIRLKFQQKSRLSPRDFFEGLKCPEFYFHLMPQPTAFGLAVVTFCQQFPQEHSQIFLRNIWSTALVVVNRTDVHHFKFFPILFSTNMCGCWWHQMLLPRLEFHLLNKEKYSRDFCITHPCLQKNRCRSWPQDHWHWWQSADRCLYIFGALGFFHCALLTGQGYNQTNYPFVSNGKATPFCHQHFSI